MSEIDRRFSNENKSIILGLRAFAPESPTFLKKEDILSFAQVYEADTDDLEIELKNMEKVMKRKENDKPSSLLGFQKYVSSIADAFFELNRLLKIACTIPVSTCTCERSFSTLRLVKNYLRNTMVEKKLKSLMVLGIHKRRSKNLDLDNIVKKFDELYPKSRIQLH